MARLAGRWWSRAPTGATAVALVGSVLVEANLPLPPGQSDVKAIDVSPLDASLLDAVVRLVRLVDSPTEARVLAPLVTLLPAVLSLVLAGPVIAEAGRAGLPVSIATQTLLPVLLIGAGTDYGLLLVYRVREEIRRGSAPRDALVIAMGRVGLSIAYSATTVIAALACLVLASFALYRGLGPSLALGVAVMLVAALTLLPALMAICGRALFWPSHLATGQATTGAWGRIAARVVRRPLVVLLAGLVLFAALATGLFGFTTGGFISGAPATSDSAAGSAALAAHFPAANSNPESLLLRFGTPIWDHPESVSLAEGRLSNSSDLRSVSGPLNPNGTSGT